MVASKSPVDSGKKRPGGLKKKLAFLVLAALIFLSGAQYGKGNFGHLGSSNTQNQNLGKLDYDSVSQVYNELRKNFDGKLDQTKLEDGLKEGLAKATGDPYTEYFNPTAAKEFNADLNGSFTGIGAELSKDAETKAIVVVAPIAGFPAEKAGLKPKDVIAEIDGKSAYDLSVSDAVKLIRGPKDTKVKLKLIRDEEDTIDVEIVRQEIKIPSVDTKTLDGEIGYIKISRFSEDTASLAQTAAQKFKQDNVKGIVLDMRGDPGGLLDAAVSVSSLWVPEGKVVLTERKDNVIIKTYKAEGGSVLNGIPTVVLIDAGSASASEITAGALRDNGVAKLYGTKSFGKGSVQQLQQLSGGGLLKVTIARWFTPNGKNIDKAGIEPDQKVERTDDDLKNNKDPQLDAATASLQK